MMYLRYKLYREGRESLLGMAYWCLTVIEYSARGRTEAADQYRVDLKVLRRLGELCGNRGGINEAKKLNGQAGVTPLKPEEREWIKTVIKTLILRVGEYAFNPIAKLRRAFTLLSVFGFMFVPCGNYLTEQHNTDIPFKSQSVQSPWGKGKSDYTAPAQEQ